MVKQKIIYIISYSFNNISTRLWNALILQVNTNVTMPKFNSLLKHFLLFNTIKFSYPNDTLYFIYYMYYLFMSLFSNLVREYFPSSSYCIYPKWIFLRDFFSIIQSLYQNVKCTVRVNDQQTDWFDVNCGLKLGCIVSPMLFNLFISDLTRHINDVCSGISLGDTPLSILLYADDIVLIADSEIKLQSLLTRLDQWCKQWGLVISANKSKVIHFKTKSVERSKEILICVIKLPSNLSNLSVKTLICLLWIK